MVARVILLQLASLSYVFALPAVGVLEDVNTAVILRDKREPGRSMTFSGFMPGRGLSAFATSGDFTPYHGYGRRPWGQGEAPATPSGEEQPPERGQSPWQQPEDKQKDEEEEEEAPAARPTKKGRKKYSPKETREEDEEEYEKPSRGGGGNAAASFNAWFPIMLGMFPSGFQGGDDGYSRDVSLSEVLVPVVVLGLPCIARPDQEILQVDLAATLSVLWGRPIPAENIGVAAPSLLAHLTPAQRLYAQLHNARQLGANFLRNGGAATHEGYRKLEEAQVRHREWLMNASVTHEEVEALYQDSLIIMSRMLSEVLTNYNVPVMCSAIVILFQILCIMGLKLIGGSINIHKPDLQVVIVGAATVGLFIIICVPSAAQLPLLASGFFFFFNSLMIYRRLPKSPALFKSFIAQSSWSWNEIIIPVGIVLFCLSLFSSSLIEEEHQLWYFLWATVATLRLAESPARWLAVLAAHRFLRRLNSTGDKWAHLPDISDWLLQHRPALSAVCGASLLCVVLCCTMVYRSRASVLLYICAAFLIYQHKAAVQQVDSLLPSWQTKSGVSEARACWWLLLLLLLLDRCSLRSLLACWMLTVSLLLRSHNTLLVPALFLISHAAAAPAYSNVLPLWLGNVFYFYQGNSNSLASVDLAAGFVGLDGYSVLPVAGLLFVHTFAMPVSAFLLHIHAVVDNTRKWVPKVVTSAETLVFLQLLHVFVVLVVITIQRYHLFVWTVFSPKLLYVAAQTFVCFVLVSITNICIYYAKSRDKLFLV